MKEIFRSGRHRHLHVYASQKLWLVFHIPSTIMSNRQISGPSQIPLEGYDTFTVKRLRLLCTVRKIPTEGLSLKHHFIHALEEDDGKHRFPFLDLPPEIRNQIYGYVVDEVRDILCHTPIPPLAGVCRSVRQEFLSTLFTRYPTTLSVKSETTRTGRTWAVRKDQLEWVSNLKPEELASLKSLSIHLFYAQEIFICWRGDLPKGQEISVTTSMGLPHLKERMQNWARAQLQPTVDAMVEHAGRGGRGISAADILSIAEGFTALGRGLVGSK